MIFTWWTILQHSILLCQRTTVATHGIAKVTTLSVTALTAFSWYIIYRPYLVPDLHVNKDRKALCYTIEATTWITCTKGVQIHAHCTDTIQTPPAQLSAAQGRAIVYHWDWVNSPFFHPVYVFCKYHAWHKTRSSTFWLGLFCRFDF